jgi:hypothetical protein
MRTLFVCGLLLACTKTPGTGGASADVGVASPDDGGAPPDLGGGPGGGAPDGGSAISGDTTPAAPPTWSTQFVAADVALFDPKTSAANQVQFGAADAMASDRWAGTLLFPGSTTLGPNDHAGPDFATEIESKMATFRYGMYRLRVRLAACAPTEEVVSGLFTYFNDGVDHDADGIIDNSEIDIEVLCGTPNILSLTVWTEYTSDTLFKKWTRAVDLSTGEVFESTAANQFGVASKGIDPQLAHPSFRGSDEYYEMGFEWEPAYIRYFIVIDGSEVTLWRFTDKTLIPTLPGRWLFNLWHSNQHWYGPGGAANYPAKDATLSLDWARYWEQ